MDSETPRWIALLLSWTPFLILIVVWIWLFRRNGGLFGKQGRYMERSEQLMERQQQILERIAAALEESNKQRR